MYFEGARLWLSGHKLYVDILDINPPLIFYLSSIAVGINKLFHLPDLLGLRFLLTTLAALSLGWLALLQRFWPERLSPYLLLAPLLSLFYNIRQLTVGEREQIFALFLVPYLVDRWLGTEDEKDIAKSFRRSMRLLTLALACLKPQFFVIVGVAELILAKGQIKTIPKSIWFIPVLYLGHFAFLPKETTKGFWQDLIPVVWNRYWTMGKSWSELFHDRGWDIALRWIGWLGILRMQRRTLQRWRTFAVLLTVTGALALGFALLQKKGWDYHFLVSDQLFVMAVAFFLAQGLSQHRYPLGQSLIFIGLLLSIYGPRTFHLGKDNQKRVAEFEDATQFRYYLKWTKKLRPDKLPPAYPTRALILGVSPAFSYPMLPLLKMEPGSRYLFLYPLSFFNNTPERAQMIQTHYPRVEEMEPEEVQFLRDLRSDIYQKRPAWIIVPRKSYSFSYLPDGFNVTTYLASSQLFDGVSACYVLIAQYADTDFLQLRERCAERGFPSTPERF